MTIIKIKLSRPHFFNHRPISLFASATDLFKRLYSLSQFPLFPVSLKTTPATFHKHLSTKAILIVILSDLHIATSPCQSPILIALALPAAFDNTVHLPGPYTLPGCWVLWGSALVLFSSNIHPLAHINFPHDSKYCGGLMNPKFVCPVLIQLLMS